MNFFSGILYNFKGLGLSFRTPSLLLLGLIRFAVILLLTAAAAVFLFSHHETLLALIWAKPASPWLVWLWYIASWVLSLILSVVAAAVGFLASQLLFSVVVMDLMSRITERLVTGEEARPVGMSLFPYFLFLARQEIPRAVVPLLVLGILSLLGLVTPLGPFLALVSPALAVVFLAWDNTDLVPARRLIPFRDRTRFLKRHFLAHLGFGLPFLIPGLNILLLSYAPVGATLLFLDSESRP